MVWLVVVGGLVGIVVVVRLCFWLTSKSVPKLPCPPPLPEEERRRKDRENGEECCLITGGLGYLGKELVLELIKKGEYSSIRVLDLPPSLPPHFNDLPIEYFQIDLVAACKREGNHQQQLEKALEGVGTVFHAAGIVRLDHQYNLLYNLHVSGTANLINTCQKIGIDQIIHTSSVAIMVDMHSTSMIDADESHPLPWGNFASEYGETKATGERLYQTHASNLRHLILRPAPIYGINDPILIAPLLRGEVPVLPKGGVGCWVYIDNIVQAHVKAAQLLKKQPSLSGNTYFITDGGPGDISVLIRSLLSLLSNTPRASLPKSLASLPPTLPTMPPFAFQGLVWVMEGAGWLTCWRWGREKAFQVTTSALRHIMCDNWFKIAAAKKDFGYDPISSQEAVKKIYQKCLESDKTK